MKSLGRTVAFLILTGFAMWVFSQTSGLNRRGYLAADAVPDMTRIAPPAPLDGDAVDLRDRAIFRATRSYAGTPRWSLALSDDNVSLTGVLKAFSCSAGVTITQESAPKLTALISRLAGDVVGVSGRLKSFYQRGRPFLTQEGPICVARNVYANNPDYPSGHTIESWAVGLVMAEMEPDRDTEILTRARAFGESRVVCGVHNASAVDAGWTVASALVAALHSSAAFRSDVEAARAELSGLRAKAPLKSPDCETEAALIAKRAY